MLTQPRESAAAAVNPDFASRSGGVPPSIASASQGAVPASLQELACGPLFERLRRGEGALLAVNLAWVGFAWPGGGTAALQFVLSTLVLMTAYALNDWHDAEGDLADPKKNQRLVKGLIRRRQGFGRGLLFAHVALVGLAALGLGPAAAAATAFMLGINAAYSWYLKGVALADLFVVGFWGAAFAAIVGASPWYCTTVGLMTSIMHLFQIEQDRHVDAANSIHTTAVRLPNIGRGFVACICAGLAALLAAQLGLLGAASAAIPLGLYLWVADTGKAWMACRLYCGLVLLAALGAFHGMG